MSTEKERQEQWERNLVNEADQLEKQLAAELKSRLMWQDEAHKVAQERDRLKAQLEQAQSEWVELGMQLKPTIWLLEHIDYGSAEAREAGTKELTRLKALVEKATP